MEIGLWHKKFQNADSKIKHKRRVGAWKKQRNGKDLHYQEK